MIYTAADILDSVGHGLGSFKIIRPTQAWEGFSLTDRLYQSLPKNWVVDVLWPAWVASLPEDLRELKRGPRGFREYPRWILKVFDCDNHANDFMTFAARQLAMMIVRAKDAAMREGVEFTDHAGTGVFGYSYTASSNGRIGGHKINLILAKNNGLVRIDAFEPADGVFISLNNNERKSAWFLCGN